MSWLKTEGRVQINHKFFISKILVTRKKKSGIESLRKEYRTQIFAGVGDAHHVIDGQEEGCETTFFFFKVLELKVSNGPQNWKTLVCA